MAAESPTDKGRQTVLRLLALRDRSEEELRQKLRGKGYDGDLIDRLLADFRALGYINDAAYAERQVRHLACDRLYGNRRIEVQLIGKGIPRERIRQEIAHVRQAFPEARALEAVLAKKLKGRTIANDVGGKRRLAQQMIGRGFPPDLIYTMLEEHIHDDDSQ